MKTKDDVFNQFQKFKAQVENQEEIIQGHEVW